MRIINPIYDVKGATDEEVLKQMIVEEEVEDRIDKHVREKEALTKLNDELAQQKDTLKKENKGLEGELKTKEDLLDKQRQIIEELKKKA